MDAWILRGVILIVGMALLAVIYFTGKPQASQGKRVSTKKLERVEPAIGNTQIASNEEDIDPELRSELNLLSKEISHHLKEKSVISTLEARDRDVNPETLLQSSLSARPQTRIDRIITLFVMAAEGETFNGADIVVAAEKTGMKFGDPGIFHRLLDGKPELGPVFVMANILNPGVFDMQTVHTLHTPGLSLFMTLPGPLTALDAWDALLPTAQRLAELLNGQLLDEERNAIGRQRIQFMRDELRHYDRQQEKKLIKKPW